MFTFVKNESDFQIVAYGFIRTRRDGFIRRNTHSGMRTWKYLLGNAQLDISTDKSVSTGSDKSVSYEK